MNSSTNGNVLEEVKQRLDIVDTVSEHVTLKKRGKNWWGCCPFHKEKTPSFTVNEEKQIFKCFGCGEGGDAISFLTKLTGQSFKEVLKELAEKFGIAMTEYSSEKTSQRKKIITLNNLALEYFKTNLKADTAGAKTAREYLKNRAITEDIIEEFFIGYATKDFDGLYKHLSEKYKYENADLELAGLCIKSTKNNNLFDRFRHRVIIPIFDEKGDCIAFGGRALDDNERAKYLNSPETPVFNKSNSLFGLYQAKQSIKEDDAVILMEGYFDVITSHVCGIKNSVATLGTALTSSHVKLLSRYMNQRRIYLAFDSDKAGQLAVERGVEVIKTAFSGLGDVKQFDESFSEMEANDKYSCEVRIIDSGEDKDPDDILRNKGAGAYRELINKAPLLVDYELNKILKRKDAIQTPQERAKITKDAVEVLAGIKNNIIRNDYAKLIAESLKIATRDIQSAISNKIRHAESSVREKKQEFQNPIVTISSQRHIWGQQNLLSLYLTNSSLINFEEINDYLGGVKFTETKYKKIKEAINQTIDDLQLEGTLDDSKRLTDNLFTVFAADETIKRELVDIIGRAEDSKNLDRTALTREKLELYIEESKSQIEDYYYKLKEAALTETTDDEAEELQNRHKLVELLKAKHNEEIEN